MRDEPDPAVGSDHEPKEATGQPDPADRGRPTPADAPDVPGQSVMLPVGDADFPETGVGTVGPGAGSTEDGVTSPARRVDEQLEPPGFEATSSEASPDLTQ